MAGGNQEEEKFQGFRPKEAYEDDLFGESNMCTVAIDGVAHDVDTDTMDRLNNVLTFNA